MEMLPAKKSLRLADPLADLKSPDLPRDACEVICQLLVASSDDSLKSLAQDISKSRTFILADQVEESGDALINALPARHYAYPKRELPNPIEYAQLDPACVGQWFCPNGEFQRAMPDYEYRAEQFEMASAVAEAFTTQRHLVVEAGTGIGKTMAYLVPSVLWSLANKVPVVISTNTKNLQEQIFHKDLPTIARIIRTPFKIAMIKGRSNYLCLNRLSLLLAHREAELDESQLLPLAHVCAWLFKTVSGDLSELEFANSLSDRLASTPEECRGRKCRFYTRCYLQSARNQSLNADIVITNHSVFFSEPDKPLALPKNAQVVFDEAHNLEEAATRKFLREVTSYSFMNTVRKLHFAGRRRESGMLISLKSALLANNFLVSSEARDAAFELLNVAMKHTDALRTAARKFLKAIADIPRKEESVLRMRAEFTSSPAWQRVVPLLNHLQDALFALTTDVEDLNNLLTGAGDAPQKLTQPALQAPRELSIEEVSPAEGPSDSAREVSMMVASLHEMSDNLDFTTNVGDRNWVYWITVSRDYDGKPIGGLHAAPIEIAKYMAETVFEKKESVILCSATMNVSNSPKFIAHRIGLDLVDPARVMSLCVGSPFDYKRQCLAAVPMFLPNIADARETAEKDYTNAFADFTARLAIVSHGRMLILFTSYKMMIECAERMEPVLRQRGIRTLVQGSGFSRERITEMFREDCPSVLMGTDSFWEGVDLIGEALSCLVIARLPFDAINDPVVSSRSERVAENGGDSFREFAMPNAIIKFRQGFGRLIRHNEDRGVVVIADQRVITKNYGGSFRNNLPAELVKYTDENTLLVAVASFLDNRGKKR